MTVKLPAEVQKFADFYFLCEDRAVQGIGKVKFRKVDKGDLARSVKVLLETEQVESMDQLCKDLSAYRQGISYTGHYYRLSNFLKQTKVQVKLRRGPRPGYRNAPKVVATLPVGFDFRATFAEGLNRALKTGMSFRTLHDQASEVLADTAHTIQVKSVTGKLQGLLRESGMNRDQLAKIVSTL